MRSHLLSGPAPNQRTTRLDKLEDKVSWKDLRKFLLFGFGDAAGLESSRNEFESVYTLAQLAFAKQLYATRTALAPNGSIVLLAQSLGAQVTSCYLWDAQKYMGGSIPRVGIWQSIDHFAAAITGGAPLTAADKQFLAGSHLRALLTTGCNIPIFVAAHATAEILPFPKPNPAFEWHNYYDKDDILGWPLAALSPEYSAAVVDHPMDAGNGLEGWLLKSWNPLSHEEYWQDDELLAPLEQLLASLLT